MPSAFLPGQGLLKLSEEHILRQNSKIKALILTKRLESRHQSAKQARGKEGNKE